MSVKVAAACWSARPADLTQDGDLLWKYSLPDDKEKVIKKIEENMLTLSPWCESWRVRTPSGSLKWIKDESKPPIPLQDGGYMWTGIITETTREHQLEEALNYQQHALQISEKNPPGDDRYRARDCIPGTVSA